VFNESGGKLKVKKAGGGGGWVGAGDGEGGDAWTPLHVCPEPREPASEKHHSAKKKTGKNGTLGKAAASAGGENQPHPEDEPEPEVRVIPHLVLT
jgi:hypothetical protein